MRNAQTIKDKVRSVPQARHSECHGLAECTDNRTSDNECSPPPPAYACVRYKSSLVEEQNEIGGLALRVEHAALQLGAGVSKRVGWHCTTSTTKQLLNIIEV